MTKIKHWFNSHKHQLSLTVLVGGFIFDNFALRHADLPLVQAALLGYLGFIAVGIILFNLYNYQWLLYLIQFSFGNLFSGFVILYFYSAPWIISWPFLLLLFLAFLSSEFGKKHYLRFSFQTVVFFLAIFSFSVFYLPIVLGEISARVFLLSGIVSLALVGVFLVISAWALPKLFVPAKRRLIWGIGGTFILLNVFYFTNILPPIPLSLKEVGVYHSVAKTASGFAVKDEQRAWWELFQLYPTIHLTPAAPVYVYSAVFAPTTITTGIIHHWEFYDEAEKDWVSASKIPLVIAGGRDGGYRSYSQKSAVVPGWWRVSVETARGQVIGRLKFRVERAAPNVIIKLWTKKF